jgi:DNA-binding GntR family transcriptional regulator
MQPLAAPRSLTERAYQAILDEIVAGALAPGTHLVQEQLAAALGVSRQPIQQALALLKSEGLVEEAPGRGLRVAALDLGLMRHHYAIRAALDALAARLAAERAAASPAVAREVERRGMAIIRAGQAAVSAGAIERMVRCDVEFHRFLFESSGNPLLATTAEPHWRYLRRVMGEVLRRAAPAPAIWRQHQDILEAIVRGDAQAAVAHATRHVEQTAQRLAAVLEGGAAGEARSARPRGQVQAQQGEAIR